MDYESAAVNDLAVYERHNQFQQAGVALFYALFKELDDEARDEIVEVVLSGKGHLILQLDLGSQGVLCSLHEEGLEDQPTVLFQLAAEFAAEQPLFN